MEMEKISLKEINCVENHSSQSFKNYLINGYILPFSGSEKALEDIVATIEKAIQY